MNQIETVEEFGDIRNCKVAYKCPKNWSNLEHLTDTTKHCDTCDQTVFLCRTNAELSEAVRKNHCVAISPDFELNQTLGANFVVNGNLKLTPFGARSAR